MQRFILSFPAIPPGNQDQNIEDIGHRRDHDDGEEDLAPSADQLALENDRGDQKDED